MCDEIDESYVAELLRYVVGHNVTTLRAFRDLFMIDIAQGYGPEVDEACRRYFSPTPVNTAEK